VWKKKFPFGKWGSAWERPPGVGRGHGKGGLWGLLVITFFKEIGSSSVSIFLIN